MKQLLQTMAIAACLIAAACSVNAEAFSITINTSSIVGVTGNLFLQFNQLGIDPGNVTLTIDHFSSDATLQGAPLTFGTVTGAFPGVVTFVDDPGLNYYDNQLIFGNTLTIAGKFNPYGSAQTPSFGVSLFNQDFTQALLTDDPSGAIATVVQNPDGSVTTTTSTYNGGPSPATIFVPEPSPAAVLALGAFGLVTLAAARRRRRTVQA
jgi:hypothetical protein